MGDIPQLRRKASIYQHFRQPPCHHIWLTDSCLGLLVGNVPGLKESMGDPVCPSSCELMADAYKAILSLVPIEVAVFLKVIHGICTSQTLHDGCEHDVIEGKPGE